MTRLFALAAFAGFLASACARHDAALPPIGQLLVYVNTDAPLPPAAGEALGPDDPLPLFDRVRVEVFAPGDRQPCAGCTHEFDLDRALVGEGRASAGVVAPPGVSGYRARVRLFAARFVEVGEPRADATIDVTVALPPAAREGVTPVTVVLRTDDVAHPVGSLDAPAAVQPGPAAPGLVGTWARGERAGCTGGARPGQVCFRSGAYWMGNPLLRRHHVDRDSVVLRVAAVSPFYLDTEEVTVAKLRASGLAAPTDPMRFNDADGAPGPILHCTYTDDVGGDEALPVNCVGWDVARAYCAAKGGDLPTEAQFQYAASGTTGALFVWGDDTPECSDAVFAAAAVPGAACPTPWLAPPGSGARDRLTMPEGVVVDLAGNVAELALDAWQYESEGCWQPGVAVDPLCTEHNADSPKAHTVTGGSWITSAGWLAAASRQQSTDLATAALSGPAGGLFAPGVANVGFRCARSGAAPP